MTLCCRWQKYKGRQNLAQTLDEQELPLRIWRAQGRIKAGADVAAAPGPHPNIGPPLH